MKVKQKQPVRGEVYLCQFDPARGSEKAVTRPAVIVERTAFSSVAAKRHVLVAAFTTNPKNHFI
jgi:mRNA-degrading endonuclease toxin of MazEF toxin-antitoxin module